MERNRRFITDVFKESICCICSLTNVNQYYNIETSYIDYCGNVISFKQIIQNLDISLTDCDDLKEICMDCKDNAIKFFHFKRKAQENQKKMKATQLKIKKARHFPEFNDKATIINDEFIATDNIEEGSVIDLELEEADMEEVMIKEEVEENSSVEQYPLVVSHPKPQRNHRILKHYEHHPDSSESSVESYEDMRYEDNNRGKKVKKKKLSASAISMRKYRARLKLPENREKLLQNQKNQREWSNKRANTKNESPTRKRRRRRNSDD